jgi:hypothetical protein
MGKLAAEFRLSLPTVASTADVTISTGSDMRLSLDVLDPPQAASANTATLGYKIFE